jgi:hypothetical protein
VRRCSESVAQLLFLEKAVYILPSLSFLSTPSLPSREQLLRTWARAVTIVCWAVALTFTAGRLSRKLWELVRPGLARALQALALLLDPQLPSYPDQPEPDLGLGIIGPTCPSCGRDNSDYGNICTADDCPGAGSDPRPTHIKITPSPEMLAVVQAAMGAPVIRDSRMAYSDQLAAVPASAATKPRPARRSRAKAAPKEAA